MVDKLVKLRRKIKIKPAQKFLTKCIRLMGVILPQEVVIGDNVSFVHDAIGSVFHKNTTLEDNVTIFQGVTIGKADVVKNNPFIGHVIIKKGAVLCAGAKILAKDDVVTEIGENSIISANAVLLNSTGPNEIWGGVPAKLIGHRKNK